MNWKARRIALIFALILVARGPLAALAGGAPPGLIALEREVSLKIAHVRDEGPVDATKRAMISEAERLDQKGEQEIAAADYNGASRDLLAANKILDGLVN